MVRIALSVPLALAAMLAAANAATAGDIVPVQSGFSGGPVRAATVTLGGSGTAASAKAAPDSELAWYHGYYRGYRHGYYSGYYGGLGGYYTGYYPYAYPYAVGYYSPAFYPPVLGYYGRFGGVSVGLYGIKGTASDASAPAVSLNLAGGANSLAQRQLPPQQAPAATAQPGGTYRYDGGPASPVPLPKQDLSNPSGQANPQLPATAGLPVSLPKTSTQPTKPLTYKAYGEK
jgi:hypothetical protein